VNLLKKLFGKQEETCCTVKIEEVKETKDGTDSCCNVKIVEVEHTQKS
jgi:hypothetical protein